MVINGQSVGLGCWSEQILFFIPNKNSTFLYDFCSQIWLSPLVEKLPNFKKEKLAWSQACELNLLKDFNL
jgi:hypothetical protein